MMELTPLQKQILELIKQNPKISFIEIGELLNKCDTTIGKNVKVLKENNIIKRMGYGPYGYWIILNSKN